MINSDSKKDITILRSKALVLAFFVILIDQISKFLIVLKIPMTTEVHLFPCLDFVHVRNKGICFGFFQQSSGLAHGILGVVILGVCSFLIWKWLQIRNRSHKWTLLSYTLIISGAFGNILDRFFYGAVIDFIDFHISNLTLPFFGFYTDWHWPAFNIADSVIILGIIILGFSLKKDSQTESV